MKHRGKALVLALVVGAFGLVVPGAAPASAAPSCSAIPQTPYRTEIGTTRTFLIHWPIYFTCTAPIVSSTAFGTLTRDGLPWDATADYQPGLLNYIVLHNTLNTAPCPPATQSTYTSSLSGVVVTTAGAVVVGTSNMSASINCALF
jgi:hypothetical protein